MMNGYSSADFLGRTGKSLSVSVDGQRMVFRGESAVPCTLQLNGADTTPSSLVYAGDSLLFTPAVPGKSAQRTLSDLLGRDFTGLVTINGQSLPLDTPLQSGDVILTGAQAAAAKVNPPPPPEPPAPPAPTGPLVRPEAIRSVPAQPAPLPPPIPEPPPEAPAPAPTPAPPTKPALRVTFNGQPLSLQAKPDGAPYYLMDLLDRSGIDFDHLQRSVDLLINGQSAPFMQELRPYDDITIRYTAE